MDYYSGLVQDRLGWTQTWKCHLRRCYYCGSYTDIVWERTEIALPSRLPHYFIFINFFVYLFSFSPTHFFMFWFRKLSSQGSLLILSFFFYLKQIIQIVNGVSGCACACYNTQRLNLCIVCMWQRRKVKKRFKMDPVNLFLISFTLKQMLHVFKDQRLKYKWIFNTWQNNVLVS